MDYYIINNRAVSVELTNIYLYIDEIIYFCEILLLYGLRKE